MISRPIAIARGERAALRAILGVSNDIDSIRPSESNGVDSHLAKEKSMTLLDSMWARRVAAATRRQDIRIHAFGTACRTTCGYAHAGWEVTNG
ncbi:hypothetical protein CFB49_24205 [Burkholderia sp. AU17457]|nr:hypothetical protein CFB49_24205 [Burkholderia sp. AU17457]